MPPSSGRNGKRSVGDEELSTAVVAACYGNDIKRKLITALAPVKQSSLIAALDFEHVRQKLVVHHAAALRRIVLKNRQKLAVATTRAAPISRF